jgi:hypothetical protein
VREDVEQGWVRYSASVLSLQYILLFVHLRVAAPARSAPTESAGLLHGTSA